MKFLTKQVLSLGTIIWIHIAFSVALMLSWTIIKRDWDFSVTSFPNELFYMSGGVREFDTAAVVIGAMFKYLYFNHLSFYIFNIVVSTVTVTVFYHLARTCLDRKLSLYLTALFAFNPELAFYNNFVLKENVLVLLIVAAMYFFFKALATNSLTYKILFCLLLPLIAVVRIPLALMVFLPLALLPNVTVRRVFFYGIAVASGLLCLMHGQCIELFRSYWASHLGHYGVTRILLEDIYGVPTMVTFGELFSSPALLAEYLARSIAYYMRPGWNAGVKLNSFLVPYTLFVVYVFVASFRYRKFLSTRYRKAHALIVLTIVAISMILIIYDPVERYRYSVYQMGFSLLVLNFCGYQEYSSQRPGRITAELGAIREG